MAQKAEIRITKTDWTATVIGSGQTKTMPLSAWEISTPSDLFIQTDIWSALDWIAGVDSTIDEDGVRIIIPASMARSVSQSGEYKAYIGDSSVTGTHDADQSNPNHEYGLTTYFYGVHLMIEKDPVPAGS